MTGTITEISYAYSESNNNITVIIQVADMTFKCYKMAGGSDLAVGDTITVTGEITNYNGSVQFAQGATYVKVEAEA